MRTHANDDDFEDSDQSIEDWDDEDETVPCPCCQQPVYDDAVRCPGCGSYLSREDSPKRRPWWIVLGVMMCLAVVWWWITSLPR